MALGDLDLQVPDAAPIEQDPDPWFADGSIVVIAEGTGFRVHMSLLSRASPVLRDMFTVPQPAPGDTTSGGAHQGVPVVHVSDSAHDMRCMLHAIYDKKDRVEQWHESSRVETWAKLPSLFGLDPEELGKQWVHCNRAWYKGTVLEYLPEH